MSNEIRFRIFEMLATHDDELTVQTVLDCSCMNLYETHDILSVISKQTVLGCSCMNLYETHDILSVISDMAKCNQIKYFSFHTRTYIYPYIHDMYLADRIRYYDD